MLASWKYSCDWPLLTKLPPPMSRHSGSALSFPSPLFLGLNAFLFTVLYVTFQLITTEWRCPDTVEGNVLSSLPVTLFVVMKLWGSFVSSLTIQLFWTWSGNHPPKFFLQQKIHTTIHSHTYMLLRWWRMFSYSTKQIWLNTYFGMGEQVVVYINENLYWCVRASLVTECFLTVCWNFERASILETGLSCVFPWVVVATVDSEC